VRVQQLNVHATLGLTASLDGPPPRLSSPFVSPDFVRSFSRGGPERHSYRSTPLGRNEVARCNQPKNLDLRVWTFVSLWNQCIVIAL
jgi:hypothetical protein